MPGLLDDLVLLLNEQAENYENLLALSAEKKDVIVQNDVETLQKITSLESRIVSDNGSLERKRLSVMKDIAIVLGRDEKELTLSALLDIMDGQPGYLELFGAGERIRAALSELTIINEQNRVLIDNALDYIEFTMNMITSSMSDETHYAARDGGDVQGGNVFFDAKQ